MKFSKILLLVSICSLAVAVLKGAKLTGIPELVHEVDNCWINSGMWILYNIPELKEELVGKGGEWYLKTSVSGPAYKESSVELAKAFTQFIRVLNSGNKNSLAESQALREKLGGLDTNDVEDGVTRILMALSNQSFLWNIKITGFSVYDSGLWVGIASINDWKKLPESVLNFLLEDIRFEVKNQTLTLLQANKQGYLLFDELSQYLIFKVWVDLNEDGSIRYPPSPAGVLLMTITLEPFASPALKKRVKEQGLSLDYELIGIAVYEGWAHYTAYIKDQYDLQHPWYHCDDIHPLQQCSKITEKEIQESWGSGRFPRVLVYRRIGGSKSSPTPKSITSSGEDQLTQLASAFQTLGSKKYEI